MPIPDSWIHARCPRIFLAGIIQGSLPDSIHDQDYRKRLRSIVELALPDALVYCPIDHHPDSLHYTFDEGRRCFLDHIEMAASANLLIAYVPQASMGTAVEMWECFRRGVPIVTISPMSENWTIKFLSAEILKDMKSFERFVAEGELKKLLNSV